MHKLSPELINHQHLGVTALLRPENYPEFFLEAVECALNDTARRRRTRKCIE